MNQIDKTYWSIAIQSTKFLQFEDPITGTLLDKIKYNEIYGKVCELLMGDDNYDFCVETFFASNPINNGSWHFVDEDARLDLYDIAVEEGILPPLKEIHEGESEKERRMRNNMAKNKQKTNDNVIKATKKVLEHEEAIVKYKQLHEKLKTVTKNSAKYNKIMRQIKAITKILENSI